MQRASVFIAARAGRDGRPAGRLRRCRLARLLLRRRLLLLAVPDLRASNCRYAARLHGRRRRLPLLLLLVLLLLMWVPALRFVRRLLRPGSRPCRRSAWAGLPCRRRRPAQAAVLVLLLLESTLLLLLPVVRLLLRRGRMPDRRPRLQTGGGGGLTAAVLPDCHHRSRSNRRCVGNPGFVMARAHADRKRDAGLRVRRHAVCKQTATVTMRSCTAGVNSRPGVLRRRRLLLSLLSRLLGLRLRHVGVAAGRRRVRRGCRRAGLLVVLTVLRRVGRGAVRLRGPWRGRGTTQQGQRIST